MPSSRLLKGYGDTYARGLKSYTGIMKTLARLPISDETARVVAELQTAALADEDGTTLSKALRRVA